ncbi:hypothetical protein DM860_014819 [Cuscuta australis]|uniref:Uncharacterized protein n=1 Tax=Cuscuta australis TaxID=267555 RepID=A0A328D4X7_9ASTE|nr:hypothetical protein DM860_014819 [Cuscuta australis]
MRQIKAEETRLATEAKRSGGIRSGSPLAPQQSYAYATTVAPPNSWPEAQEDDDKVLRVVIPCTQANVPNANGNLSPNPTPYANPNPNALIRIPYHLIP